MKKTILLSTLLLSASLLAQKKNITMEDAVLGLSTNLRIENLNQVQWIPNQNAFTQNVKTSYGEALIKKEVPSLKTDTIFRSSQFENKRIPSLNWINDKQAYFSTKTGYKTITTSGQQADWLKLPDNAENVEFDATNNQAGYVIDNNLFFVDKAGKTHQITKDGKYEIVNGKSVHQNEFGIHKGIFISPKGNLVAFYKMDQTVVTDYPIIDWSVQPAVNKNIKYPFAGTKNHTVRLGVYNPSTQKTIFLETQPEVDHYLTSVTWSPDEKHIYIALLSRNQKHMELNQYDAISGKLIKTLFKEDDAKYVEPQNELHFIPGKTNEFVWWSQRDGFMHLYRFNTDGKLLNQITKGDWIVTDLVGENAKKKELLVMTTKDSPKERQLYAVNWENGKLRKITTDAGTHNVSVSSNGEYIVDNWSNDNTPRKIDVIAANGKLKQNILTAQNPLANYNTAKVENITLKADDGTDLYGKLIYPTNFDQSKKYPVIVYLYNGPHAQLITNRFPATGNLWYDHLAEKGYVVFTMDGRGSANRGLKFEQAIHGNVGTTEMNDQMKGVDFLKTLPFVDADRMGIHGWSYGGFMTTSFMLRKPDVFKVGVAGGPVLDWTQYEIMYTERYMESPQDNPEGYKTSNLINRTKDLKGKLLMIHGAQDPVVVWQHSVDFVREAVKNGVQMDYFIYPGHEHNVRGKDRVHLMQKITDYFDLYLKPESTTTK
ncbi:DPP IV N-terminal domain-containing protein [Empedobacter sp. 225-1]|uniref:S9 family peptidase n=1 Tax=unclassified Empedobacter TaxID=2643773 RepID=UPI0025784FB8|nr:MULTISPECIES: DPP IV N-terminal domain-containing protein [unclassified Empedobacter]MDM1522108.1 DPP IV N-terminal domain-containing protein [Empedobacter sp. 225-1]MDM1542118.1 DPP IV N-terminal domain-containing protein [Empedobacter sp. 189-2]